MHPAEPHGNRCLTPEDEPCAALENLHDRDGTNADVAMGSIYSYRLLMFFRILSQAPIDFVDARVLMQYLLPAITIVGITCPSEQVPAGACGWMHSQAHRRAIASWPSMFCPLRNAAATRTARSS